MTFSLVFAIVQLVVFLPIQGYALWRSMRNWKQSERDRMEAAEKLAEARVTLTMAREIYERAVLDEPSPPTVQ
jgi:hypothetical protein